MKIIKAIIIRKYVNAFLILYNNQKLQAVAKAKNNSFVVGDLVEAEILDNDQVRIIQLLSRKNLLFRCDHRRIKIIASNVTQVFIVISSIPKCNFRLLDSSLVFCESQCIKPIIVVNKSDLLGHVELYNTVKQIYMVKLGYQVVNCNHLMDINHIFNHILSNNTSAFIGQSGVGKSTIIGSLLSIYVKSGALSNKGKGCHTTTVSAMYQISNNGFIIDSPGLNSFGLNNISKYDLGKCFIEFFPYLDLCKFNNCLHVNELNCAVLNALSQEKIIQQRYDSYLEILRELL